MRPCSAAAAPVQKEGAKVQESELRKCWLHADWLHTEPPMHTTELKAVAATFCIPSSHHSLHRASVLPLWPDKDCHNEGVGGTRCTQQLHGRRLYSNGGEEKTVAVRKRAHKKRQQTRQGMHIQPCCSKQQVATSTSANTDSPDRLAWCCAR